MIGLKFLASTTLLGLAYIGMSALGETNHAYATRAMLSDSTEARKIESRYNVVIHADTFEVKGNRSGKTGCKLSQGFYSKPGTPQRHRGSLIDPKTCTFRIIHEYLADTTGADPTAHAT